MEPICIGFNSLNTRFESANMYLGEQKPNKRKVIKFDPIKAFALQNLPKVYKNQLLTL